MQIKLFTIPIGDSGATLAQMNSFLRSNKILEVENHLISNQNGAYWCFCIHYIEKTSHQGNYKTKVDYKQVLDDETFKKFLKLREIRKKVAADEGIPAFAIFTNEELAGTGVYFFIYSTLFCQMIFMMFFLNSMYRKA